MTGKIYLIQNNKSLQALTRQPYPKEEDFQVLLEQYPDLLAGDQMNEVEPRKWLLVAREMGVPGEEGGTSQWSLDLLFLDQDGIPTLVEVKRAGDTRLRREVVGQMLDYAANAIVYWPVETIRARFEATCEKRKQDPMQLLAELLGISSDDEAAIEDFWMKVKTNLQAARIRLIFVADEIPRELRRIVEFLNATMDPVEVLAVEISQYVGPNLKTLVPRVVGQTADAQSRKGTVTRTMRLWDETTFFDALAEAHTREVVAVARSIYEWASKRLDITWGKGSLNGAFFGGVRTDTRMVSLFAVWNWVSSKPASVYLEIQGGYLRTHAPFNDPELWRELCQRLRSVWPQPLPAPDELKFPKAALHHFTDEARLRAVFEVFEWGAEQIRMQQGRGS